MYHLQSATPAPLLHYVVFTEFDRLLRINEPDAAGYHKKPLRPKKQRKYPTNSQSMLEEIFELTKMEPVEISEISNIPLSTIYDLVSGRTHKPHSPTFKRLFEFYCYVITKYPVKEN